MPSFLSLLFKNPRISRYTLFFFATSSNASETANANNKAPVSPSREPIQPVLWSSPDEDELSEEELPDEDELSIDDELSDEDELSDDELSGIFVNSASSSKFSSSAERVSVSNPSAETTIRALP